MNEDINKILNSHYDDDNEPEHFVHNTLINDKV